jgi:RNA polymerase sigma-70 factor, ECF subfamily
MVTPITNDVTSHERLLLQEIAEGSFGSFERAFKQYYQPLCHHAYTYSHDAASAEDAVSEVFARLWEKRGQLDIEVSLKSYLFRSVSNQCIDQLRKSYHRRVVLSEGMDAYQGRPSAENVASVPEARELSNRIEEALRGLPRQCGIIFRLSREAGMKYQEIARHLGISVKTVETQMGRAFKSLRQCLPQTAMA